MRAKDPGRMRAKDPGRMRAKDQERKKDTRLRRVSTSRTGMVSKVRQLIRPTDLRRVPKIRSLRRSFQRSLKLRMKRRGIKAVLLRVAETRP
jgi:hypothetical protein